MSVNISLSNFFIWSLLRDTKPLFLHINVVVIQRLNHKEPHSAQLKTPNYGWLVCIFTPSTVLTVQNLFHIAKALKDLVFS